MTKSPGTFLALAFLAIFCGAAVALCSATAASSIAQDKSSQPVLTNELYSWKDGNGVWTFAILGPTNRQKTAEEIFNERHAIHGVNELKKRISRLDQPSRLVWFDRLTLNCTVVKGTERLSWPPKDVIEDVKRYAAARRIEVSGPD